VIVVANMMMMMMMVIIIIMIIIKSSRQREFFTGIHHEVSGIGIEQKKQSPSGGTLPEFDKSPTETRLTSSALTVVLPMYVYWT